MLLTLALILLILALVGGIAVHPLLFLLVGNVGPRQHRKGAPGWRARASRWCCCSGLRRFSSCTVTTRTWT